MRYFDIDITTAVYCVSGMGVCVLLILLGLVWYHDSKDHNYVEEARKSEELQRPEMKGDSVIVWRQYDAGPWVTSGEQNVFIGRFAGYRIDSQITFGPSSGYCIRNGTKPVGEDTTSRHGRRRN